MMSKTTVAAVQMVSSPSVDENLETARRLLREAGEKVEPMRVTWAVSMNSGTM